MQILIRVMTSDTETDNETDNNGLHRIVWKCLYYTRTCAKTDSNWVLCKFICISFCLGGDKSENTYHSNL